MKIKQNNSLYTRRIDKDKNLIIFIIFVAELRLAP